VIISKEKLQKIKTIIEKSYGKLLISTVGSKVFTKEELDQLEASGVDTSNESSLLELIYHNYLLNDLRSPSAPRNISEMRKQQQSRAEGLIHTSAEEHVNESFKQYVDKLNSDVQASFEGIIRDTNMSFRNNSIANLDRSEALDELVRESTVGQIKSALKDYLEDANRNYERIAVTEVANSLGMGSVDRIALSNPEKKPEDILVFRIPVRDAALCKHCRKFYLDEDETPAVYKLSTLLANGTNYGKKTADWKPVAVATHPNDRESGVIELKPGWKVQIDGRLEFIGLKEWNSYIAKKLKS
jgi:hypothetical protein